MRNLKYTDVKYAKANTTKSKVKLKRKLNMARYRNTVVNSKQTQFCPTKATPYLDHKHVVIVGLSGSWKTFKFNSCHFPFLQADAQLSFASS